MSKQIAEFHRRYEEIIKEELPPYERDKKLAALMTEMERVYRIPMLGNPQWEKENKAVMSLYRMISNSRVTF